MTLFAPYNETTMKLAMAFAKEYTHPCAFRYPRGAFMADDCESEAFELGKSKLLKEGRDTLFVGYGNGVGRAIRTAEHLDDIDPAILDLRFVKPLDQEKLGELASRYSEWFVFSDSARMGGVGSALMEFLSDAQIGSVRLTTFEYEDNFITHGKTKLVEESLGLLPEQLAAKVKAHIEKHKG